MSALTLFISDLHLDQNRPDSTRAFLNFLDSHASRAQSLYILGDFFDTWIGDDYLRHEPKDAAIEEILTRLKQCTDNGLKLYFMHGNRDFLLGNEFMQRTGGKLLCDPTVIQLDSQPTLLMHGDSLCTQDTEYMNFRAESRSPEWIQDQLSKPISQRIAFAKHLRNVSMKKNSQTAENILDVDYQEVINVMEKHGVTQLIHGHTHRPKIHTISIGTESKKRYVLGDWDNHAWYLSHQCETLQLLRFDYP